MCCHEGPESSRRKPEHLSGCGRSSGSTGRALSSQSEGCMSAQELERERERERERDRQQAGRMLSFLNEMLKRGDVIFFF